MITIFVYTRFKTNSPLLLMPLFSQNFCYDCELLIFYQLGSKNQVKSERNFMVYIFIL